MKQLAGLLLSLVALVTVGCGSSTNDYVYNGNVNPSLTGDVTFEFTKPATQAVVPVGTTKLHFDFYSEIDTNGDPTSLPDLRADADYATSVTIENVPVSAIYVVITAYGAYGIPLAVIATPLTVYGGQTTTANLAGVPVTAVSAKSVTATPVNVAVGGNAIPTVRATFDSGESVTLHPSLFSVTDFDNTTVRYAADTGFQGLTEGSTSYTASYSGITSMPTAITVSAAASSRQLVLSPTGGKVARNYDGRFDVRGVMTRLGISAMVGNQTVTSAIGYDTALGGEKPGSFVIEHDGTFRISGGAASGDSCTIPVHYNDGDTELTSSFKVVLGPTAWLNPGTTNIVSPVSNTTTALSYVALDVNGDNLNSWGSFGNLKLVSGFSDVVLVSSDTSWLTVDNSTGGFTVLGGTTAGHKGYVWLMQGDLILDSVTVTVSST